MIAWYRISYSVLREWKWLCLKKLFQTTIHDVKSVTLGFFWLFGTKATDKELPPTTLNVYSSVCAGDLFGSKRSKFINWPSLILSMTAFGRWGRQAAPSFPGKVLSLLLWMSFSSRCLLVDGNKISGESYEFVGFISANTRRNSTQ